MQGRKIFTLFLAAMLLIAALGAFAVIAGAKAYRERPRMEDHLPWTERIFGENTVVEG